MQNKKNGKLEKIDSIDEQIMELLSQDGRIPNTEVAEKLNLAEATARRRIHRLKEEKIIKIVGIPNPDYFDGFVSSIININCERIFITSTVNFLVDQPEVRFAGYSTGKWNLVIEAVFLDNDHLLEFLLKLGEKDGIDGLDTSVILRIAKFSYEWEVNPLIRRLNGE